MRVPRWDHLQAPAHSPLPYPTPCDSTTDR
jgi:hypothetical protein